MGITISGAATFFTHVDSGLALRALQIVWINVLLSGDNAVVIALACRSLERDQRKWAILGGASAAVALRILFTFFVVALLAVPYVKMLSGILLLWIAFDLLRTHEEQTELREARSIWSAVRTIALADAIMSLDNVVAVAAAAKNSVPLIVFGVVLSVPLVVFGSTLILGLLNRFPILVVAGAVLLGWVAGDIMSSDPLVERIFARLRYGPELLLPAAGAVLVLSGAGLLWVYRRDRRAHVPKSMSTDRRDA